MKILNEDYNSFDKKAELLRDRVNSYINYMEEYDDHPIDEDLFEETIRYMIVRYPEKFGRTLGGGRLGDVEEWINQVLLSNVDVKFREKLVDNLDKKVNEKIKPSPVQKRTKAKSGALGNYKIYTRQINGDTCDWCRSLAGTARVDGYKTFDYDDNGKLIKSGFKYNYDTVSKDFFKRHGGCDCTIDVKYYKE